MQLLIFNSIVYKTADQSCFGLWRFRHQTNLRLEIPHETSSLQGSFTPKRFRNSAALPQDNYILSLAKS